MKSITLSVLFALCTASFAYAQDETMIALYGQQKQWEKAKDEVEKQLSNPKLKDRDKPMLLLWRIEVYAEIYADNALYAKYPEAEQQAISAMNDYLKYDPTMKMMKDENFVYSVNNVYQQSLSYGNDGWKAEDWAKAFKYYSTGLQVVNYMNDNGLLPAKIAVDTITTLYTAYAAQNGKMTDKAATYYQKIADLKIGGEDFKDIYKFLLDYYSNINKNNDSFAKYLAIAKELYPGETALWSQFEINQLVAGATVSQIYETYQKEKAAGTLTENKMITYAEELATVDNEKLEGLDSAFKMELKKASAEAYGQAYEANNTKGLYAYNAGVVYYMIYNALDDRYLSYRGEGKDLAAKRADIEKMEKAYADTSVLWLEKAYTTLKANTSRSKAETLSLNRCVDQLANLYAWKRDKTKGVDPKGYDVYDAKFKQYDAEHDSFH